MRSTIGLRPIIDPRRRVTDHLRVDMGHHLEVTACPRVSTAYQTSRQELIKREVVVVVLNDHSLQN